MKINEKCPSLTASAIFGHTYSNNSNAMAKNETDGKEDAFILNYLAV